jgi:hypothetical protein
MILELYRFTYQVERNSQFVVRSSQFAIRSSRSSDLHSYSCAYPHPFVSGEGNKRKGNALGPSCVLDL